ncbi:phosphoglycerate mutase [Alicyclobacillus cellulosilyticus]|uniref:Phosphoglycerate mutase n=1 Tax=Alicyclobacillus cellulosilyticus TaxID=1003997 RepID=A0A917K349_9BACL|nr:histidine phosphatase family protein [Alicyclobacillus cellulosilyticus]GGI96033.1 phosphoglycerate mutase [Alicyclobacillus cellulosilyticus]
MFEIWLVRHGETDWNHAGRLQGWTDIPLNEAGWCQARRLAAALHGVPFCAVYTSDLVRARTTASLLQRELNAPLLVTQQLRERCFGSGEGLTRQEIAERFPNGIPDAEPEAQLSARMADWFRRVLAIHRKGRILAVTHGGFIRQALRMAGVDPPATLANTCVNRFRHTPDGWRALAVNAAEHLAICHPSHAAASHTSRPSAPY